MVNIRLLTVEDYDGIYAMWLATPGMGLNHLDDSREGFEKFLRRNPQTCFVAEDGDSPVGVILAGHDGRRGFIYHTTVRPDYRRQGIGRNLVDRAMDALKNEGINKVALVVFENNSGGNAFWEEIGFTTREDLVYRNREIRKLNKLIIRSDD